MTVLEQALNDLNAVIGKIEVVSERQEQIAAERAMTGDNDNIDRSKIAQKLDDAIEQIELVLSEG